MTRISRLSQTGGASAPKKTKAVGGGFAPGEAAETAAAGKSSATPSAPMLSALIALQSRDYGNAKGGNRKTLAAAQQVLGELERLQHALLDGTPPAAAVDALDRAASLRAHAGADAKLIGVYDEIALRARVELAKLGR